MKLGVRSEWDAKQNRGANLTTYKGHIKGEIEIMKTDGIADDEDERIAEINAAKGKNAAKENRLMDQNTYIISNLGYCPYCEQKGVSSDLAKNIDDYFECPICHLQFIIGDKYNGIAQRIMIIKNKKKHSNKFSDSSNQYYYKYLGSRILLSDKDYNTFSCNEELLKYCESILEF